MLRNFTYANGRDYFDRRNRSALKLEVELSGKDLAHIERLLREASRKQEYIEMEIYYRELAERLERLELEESNRYLEGLIQADAEVDEMLDWMHI